MHHPTLRASLLAALANIFFGANKDRLILGQVISMSHDDFTSIAVHEVASGRHSSTGSAAAA